MINISCERRDFGVLAFNISLPPGATLMEIKKSFRNVDNVLYDWTEATGSDYCSWRGVTCDNTTFNIVAL